MDALLHAPRLNPAEATALAQQLYGVDAEAALLPSERDRNFALRTAAGDRFVLKVANSTDQRALLEAQNAALQHVSRSTTLCPRVIPATDGQMICSFTPESGTRHFVRLLTWLEGEPLASVQQPAPLLESLGTAVAELNTALEGFDHPAIHREFHWDLARGLVVCPGIAPSVADPSLRELVLRLLGRIERSAALFARFRRAAVHNDPNDYNVLVTGETITGLLDFGDIVYSYAVSDLAIAAAYATLGKRDPLAAAVSVVRGYQRQRALEENEIDALFELMLLRLCTSVCIAERQRQL